MLNVLASTALVAFLSSLATVEIFRRLFLRIGIIDRPSGRKCHEKPTPYGGGLGILTGVILPLAGGAALVAFVPGFFATGVFVEFLPHLDGARAQFPTLAAIMAGGAALATLGLIDDARDLSPWIKLAVEFAVAGTLVFGFDVNATFFMKSAALSKIVSVLWIVAITNSFNLIDNMDGYASGVAAIASFFFLIVAIKTGQFFIAVLFSVVIGSALGFLAHNFPPARVFMGDAGALLLGYLISVSAILFTYFTGGSRFFAVIMPLVILAVPLYDTTSVVYVRLIQRRPIFAADRSHLSHRLLDSGMTPRKALFTIYLITFATGMAALNLHRVDEIGAFYILVQTLALVAVLALLENLSGYAGKK